jgi:class 3 adenylate cyclase/tetratricopeptide (TPR) repeat protein
VATVLFADLAGYTGLSEAMDPEHLKNLMDRCFAELAADVTSHGGRVDKVIGDAIVALYGAPVAHEDDAERAVRTGLQMQRTISTLSADLGVALQLRVGINSGEVLVGAMRAGGDYTAMGDAVNVASRLQSMATPGTVVVGPATYSATSSVMRYDALGPLHTRGREASVDAWQAIESLSTPGRRPRRVDAPLIGRDDELTVLRQSVQMAIRRRRPSVSFLLGEAGMGKSRLIEEVADWAALEYGALVLEGRCVPYGEANPWWPIAEAVRRACGVDPGDTAMVTADKVRRSVADICDLEPGSSQAGQVAAGLLHLIGDEDALPDVDPPRARQEARRSLHALISGLTRTQPVVLVLSELHWADDVVLDLFGWHLDRLSSKPFVVLTTSRFELMERWDPPYGRYNLLTLHLDPLDPTATHELAEALGAGSLPPDVVDALVQRSGGNPFFLEELLTLVTDQSAERRPGDLPVTLRGLVAARIDALAADERSVLEDAAVIGRSGSRRILCALSGLRGVEDAEVVADRLFERDLLGGSDVHWEFRSDVVREVLYETLTKSERARRHWDVGSWLADAGRRTGRTDEMLELVAHHYATAAELVAEVGVIPGVPADALVVATEAVERAAGWSSRRELPWAAIRQLDRGIGLSAEGSPTQCRLLLERALEWTELRDTERARQDLESADPAGDPTLTARRLTVLGVVEQLEGDLTASSRSLAAAVEAFRVIGDRAGEGDALRRAGLTYMHSADAVAAEAAFEEARTIARDLGSRRDEAWAMWHLAELSFYAGRAEEAEARLQDAGRAFEEAGDTGGLGWVRGLLGYLRYVQGDREEAAALAGSILDDVRDRGDRWALGMVLLLLASVHLWQGRAAVAVEEATEAGAAFAEIGELSSELRATGIIARALAALGRAADAWAIVDEVVERRPDATREDPDLTVPGVAVHLGDGDLALDVLSRAHIIAFAEEVRIIRGQALLQAGRPDEARDCLEQVMLEHQDDTGLGANGWACRSLARAATGDAAGALDAADRSLATGPAATYRDLVLAHTGRALALRQMARYDDASAAIAAARRECAGTDDVVTAAVVELAAARLGGDETDVIAARAGLDRLGASSAGWDTLIRAGLGKSAGRSDFADEAAR